MQNQMLKHGKRADMLENEHMEERFTTNKAPLPLCTAAAIEIQGLAATPLFA